VLRAGRELSEPHGAQLASQGLPADVDAEFVQEPLNQIYQAPADDAIQIRLRPILDRLPEGCPLRIIQTGRRARAFPVDQPVGTFGVESDHPVADDLQANPCKTRGMTAPSAIIDLRQSQQPASLCSIPALLRQSP